MCSQHTRIQEKTTLNQKLLPEDASGSKGGKASAIIGDVFFFHIFQQRINTILSGFKNCQNHNLKKYEYYVSVFCK